MRKIELSHEDVYNEKDEKGYWAHPSDLIHFARRRAVGRDQPLHSKTFRGGAFGNADMLCAFVNCGAGLCYGGAYFLSLAYENSAP